MICRWGSEAKGLLRWWVLPVHLVPGLLSQIPEHGEIDAIDELGHADFGGLSFVFGHRDVSVVSVPIVPYSRM